MSAYRILSVAPKWQAFRDKSMNVKVPNKRRLIEDGKFSPGSLSATASNDGFPERPQGSSVAKKQARSQDQMLDCNLTLAAASQRLAEETARKNELMERSADVELFTKSLDGLDDESINYLKLHRSMEFARLKAIMSPDEK